MVITSAPDGEGVGCMRMRVYDRTHKVYLLVMGLEV